MTVYPRVGGGTCHSATRSGTSFGLSPRGRGNRRTHSSTRLSSRSIPALGGGTGPVATTIISCYGLSPRGRGNLHRHYQPKVKHRSIPAWAGEPRYNIPDGTDEKVYPRVGGGTAGARAVYPLHTRSIPAWGGNRLGWMYRLDSSRSIPRGGGTLSDYRATLVSKGLSRVGGGPFRMDVSVGFIQVYPPRGRGTAKILPNVMGLAGLSPRGGGTTLVKCDERSTPGLSPRGRGNQLEIVIPTSGSGLSPRGRGNHQGQADGSGEDGLSPRGAGVPWKRQIYSPLAWVYPRVGGEPDTA